MKKSFNKHDLSQFFEIPLFCDKFNIWGCTKNNKITMMKKERPPKYAYADVLSCKTFSLVIV